MPRALLQPVMMQTLSFKRGELGGEAMVGIPGNEEPPPMVWGVGGGESARDFLGAAVIVKVGCMEERMCVWLL